MAEIREVPGTAIRFFNTTSLVGIFVFTLSAVVCYFGISTLNRSTFIALDRDLKYAKGQIESIAETSFGDGGELGRRPLFRIGFKYKVHGTVHRNAGYSTLKHFTPGDQLDVMYKEADPRVSKATTLKASPYGAFVLLGLILPVAGLSIFLKGLRWGDRFVRLMTNGTLTEAQFLSSSGDSEDVNHYYVYFDEKGERRRVALESSHRKADERIIVLYDQRDPENAEVLDWNNLPILFGRARIRRMLEGSRKVPRA